MKRLGEARDAICEMLVSHPVSRMEVADVRAAAQDVLRIRFADGSEFDLKLSRTQSAAERLADLVGR